MLPTWDLGKACRGHKELARKESHKPDRQENHRDKVWNLGVGKTTGNR